MRIPDLRNYFFQLGGTEASFCLSAIFSQTGYYDHSLNYTSFFFKKNLKMGYILTCLYTNS